MGMVQQMMSNSQVMSNPMIKNAMSMAQSGNSKGIEQMARNLCLLSSITYNPRADYNVCPYFVKERILLWLNFQMLQHRQLQ